MFSSLLINDNNNHLHSSSNRNRSKWINDDKLYVLSLISLTWQLSIFVMLDVRWTLDDYFIHWIVRKKFTFQIFCLHRLWINWNWNWKWNWKWNWWIFFHVKFPIGKSIQCICTIRYELGDAWLQPMKNSM